MNPELRSELSGQVSRNSYAGDSAPDTVPDREKDPGTTNTPPMPLGKPPCLPRVVVESVCDFEEEKTLTPSSTHSGERKFESNSDTTKTTLSGSSNPWQSQDIIRRLQGTLAVKRWELLPISFHNYQLLCGTYWDALVTTDDGLKRVCSREEFIHISMLLLQYRVDYVCAGYELADFNPLRSCALPEHIRVYQPLWEILQGIGSVENGTFYALPMMQQPESDNQDSSSDHARVESGTLYNWTHSWENVLASRGTLTSTALTIANVDQLGIRMSQISREIAELTTLRQKSLELERNVDGVKVIGDRIYPRTYDFHWRHGRIEYTNTQYVSRVGSYPVSNYYNKELDALYREANQLKHLSTSVPVEQVKRRYRNVSGLSVDESYNQCYHWDALLFDRYHTFCELASRDWLFSISIPHVREGNRSWLVRTMTVVPKVTVKVELPFPDMEESEIQVGSFLQMRDYKLKTRTLHVNVLYTTVDLQGFIYNTIIRGRKPP
jgi:hypothetical protein